MAGSREGGGLKRQAGVSGRDGVGVCQPASQGESAQTREPEAKRLLVARKPISWGGVWGAATGEHPSVPPGTRLRL